MLFALATADCFSGNLCTTIPVPGVDALRLCVLIHGWRDAPTIQGLEAS
jgi:hypothetical protein